MAAVCQRLGHASVATTQRIYVHQFDAAKRSGERRDRLTALYGAPAETEDAKLIELRASCLRKCAVARAHARERAID